MIFSVVKHLNFNVFILLNVYRVKLYLVFNFWWTIANVKFLNLVVNSLRYDINSVHRVNASPIIVLSNVKVSSPLTLTAKQRKSLTLPYMWFESNRTTKAIFLSLSFVNIYLPRSNAISSFESEIFYYPPSSICCSICVFSSVSSVSSPSFPSSAPASGV